jgi:hypothetical protein
MRAHGENQGFQIVASVRKLAVGGYAASVALTRNAPVPTECSFDLPLYAKLATEDEALRQAMQYGADILDGLVPSIDAPTMSE